MVQIILWVPLYNSPIFWNVHLGQPLFMELRVFLIVVGWSWV